MGSVGTGKSGTRFLKTKWPVVEGITAGTTKLRKQAALIPQKSFLLKNQKVGL